MTENTIPENVDVDGHDVPAVLADQFRHASSGELLGTIFIRMLVPGRSQV